MNPVKAFPLLAFAVKVQSQQTLEDFIKAKDAEFKAAYRERRYPAAQKAIEELLANKEVMALPSALQSLFYNLACVHALQGHKAQTFLYLNKAVDAGFSDYMGFAEDHDFAALRSDAEFQSYQKKLRRRLGVGPLVHDSGAKGPAFHLIFESSDSDGHRRLREEFALAAVVAGAKDDYERLQRLTLWTSRQWQHDPTHMASKTDALTILREAHQGGRFICMNYGSYSPLRLMRMASARGCWACFPEMSKPEAKLTPPSKPGCRNLRSGF